MHLCFSIGSIGSIAEGGQVFSYSCSLLNLSKREKRSRGEQADRPTDRQTSIVRMEIPIRTCPQLSRAKNMIGHSV